MPHALVNEQTGAVLEISRAIILREVLKPLLWVDAKDGVFKDQVRYDPLKCCLVPRPSAPPTPAPDLSDIDSTERVLKALALVMLDYSNDLKDEIRGLALLLVQKKTITAQEAAALAKYVGSGPGGKKTIADLKADFAQKYASLPGGG